MLTTLAALVLLVSPAATTAAPKPSTAPSASPETTSAPAARTESPMSVLKTKMTSIDGNAVDLSQYLGKVVMIVNTASKCGYTPQYDALEHLYEKYKDQGFVILGFPANDFGAQEPGTNEEIATFCKKNFGVTFPMFSKITVLGDDKPELYKALTSPVTNEAEPGDVKWNFEKFLIAKDGSIVHRYRSKVTPDDTDLVTAVEAELAK
jgi:glutathione peroxidase